MKKRRNREGYDALFLVIPHMRFPILIRGSLIGKADAPDALALQNGEIGPLGDLAQLVVMVEDRSGDHGCEGGIRIAHTVWFVPVRFAPFVLADVT